LIVYIPASWYEHYTLSTESVVGDLKAPSGTRLIDLYPHGLKVIVDNPVLPGQIVRVDNSFLGNALPFIVH